MIKTTVDTSRSLAIHCAVPGSDIKLQDIQFAMLQLFQHPEFEPTFSIAWDLTGSNLGISLKEIIYLDEEIVQNANEARPTGKTAWVTATAFGESIIKLLYGQHNWAAQWQTFSTLDAAIAWCVQKDRVLTPIRSGRN